MLKNDWVMGFCPNIAQPMSQSVSGEPRYRVAIAAKKEHKQIGTFKMQTPQTENCTKIHQVYFCAIFPVNLGSHLASVGNAWNDSYDMTDMKWHGITDMI